MSLHAIQCWHHRCKRHAPVKYYYPAFTVEFLVFCASVVVVFLGFCWLFGVLARSAHVDTPVTWRHAAITTVLCAASAGLITCLLW
jgi:hypothetical protein